MSHVRRSPDAELEHFLLNKFSTVASTAPSTDTVTDEEPNYYYTMTRNSMENVISSTSVYRNDQKRYIIIRDGSELNYYSEYRRTENR